MRWVFLLIFAVAYAQDPSEPLESPPQEEESQDSGETFEDCQKGIKGLKNDVVGLEFFLQDRKDYKTHCPYIRWEQPNLEEYKKEPKSYLPKNCKNEKITL